MGCLFSKHGQVRTLSDDVEEPLPASAFSTRGAAHAWLQEIGLPQYADAFDDAGFSDWDLLSCLTEPDLEAITTHTGTAIPPGHRKKLLMASRQMGTTAAQAAIGAQPPGGYARRYSHSSNPGNGNGSRAGGLAVAAAAAASLERRSNGLRPGSNSRVPSLASVHAGHAGQGHPLQPIVLPPNGQLRNATEDGLVSGRQSRAVGVLVPSHNSSRNSLSAAAPGHAIGYVASPSTGAQDIAGGGGCDAWVVGDGRRSPTDPASPSASRPTVAEPQCTTPPRQRRRWSVNKLACRGVLVGGNGGGNGMAFSTSSYGWLEPDAGVVMCGAGPITDDVRQISMTSSIGDPHFDVAGGGGGDSPPMQQCNSRDLEALVMGASDATNRMQSSRCQSLAATRPDRSYGGGCSASGRPSSPPHPPHRISAAQPGATAAGGGNGPGASGGDGLQASPTLIGDLPHIHGSIRLSAAVPATQQSYPEGHSISQPNLNECDQQTPSKQPRIGSARHGIAAATAATATFFSQSTSLRRPGSAAADTTLRSWASAVPMSPLIASRLSTGPGAAVASPPPTPPGIAWGSQAEANGAVYPAATAFITPPSAVQSVVSDVVFPSSHGNRSAGSPGGALPKFVRAIAGWAIPSSAGNGAVWDGTIAGAKHARSTNRHHRGHANQSMAQVMRPRSPSGSVVMAAMQKSEGADPEADHSVAEDFPVQAPPATTADSATQGPVLAEPSLSKPPSSRRRSQRQMMTPDVQTTRGPWDQDGALCIQGRGYKPFAPPKPHDAGRHVATVAVVGGGRGSTAGDKDTNTVQLASCAASAVSVSASVGPAVSAEVATRGGGWPFVLPQLPQPTKVIHNDMPGLPPTASVVGASGGGGGGGGNSTSTNRIRFSSTCITGTAVASTTADEDVPAISSGYGQSAAGGTTQFGRMSMAPEYLPPAMLESLNSDEGATTMARRALPMHSSRPRDWRPSGGGGGGSEQGPADKCGVASESSADELALYGSTQQLPHRVEIVSSAISLVSPYSAGGGTGKSPLRSGSGPTTAAHWPAMPLQPPTRSRPPLPPHATIVGNRGSCSDSHKQMDVLPPEAPGLGCVPATGPPGGAAAALAGPENGVLTRPTPGRKLDLEMLAEQVGRIMSHLSYIAKEDASVDVQMVALETSSAAVATTVASQGGGRDHVPEDRSDSVNGADNSKAKAATATPESPADGVVTAAADAAATAAAHIAPTSQASSRRQAIDQKRLELQQLHLDLVKRVATMEAYPPQRPPPSPSNAAAGYSDSGCGGSDSHAAAADDMSPVDALAEVESRIRTKLAELAALTMRPASERCAARASGGGSPVVSARKRMFTSESTPEVPAATSSEGVCNFGSGVESGPGHAHALGQRRAREEAALHMEVLAVLAARKRQVRRAPLGELGRAGGNGSENDTQPRQPLPSHPGSDMQPLIMRKNLPAATAAAAAAVGVAAGNSGAQEGSVLGELHDGLRAELLAIDNKIKARVLGSGAALSRRA